MASCSLPAFLRLLPHFPITHNSLAPLFPHAYTTAADQDLPVWICPGSPWCHSSLAWKLSHFLPGWGLDWLLPEETRVWKHLVSYSIFTFPYLLPRFPITPDSLATSFRSACTPAAAQDLPVRVSLAAPGTIAA